MRVDHPLKNIKSKSVINQSNHYMIDLTIAAIVSSGPIFLMWMAALSIMLIGGQI